MDLSKLKDKLGDETFSELERHVADLIGQRDTARTESINGRKKLKSDLEAAQALAAKALEKLGVDNADDLDTLPDAKGQGEALKQYETKLKRAERERDEARQAAEKASGMYRTSLQKAAVADALGGHEFVARDIVETYIGQRLVWEGEELMFKTDAGSLVSVKDGVAGVAKARPELLKPTGTGGAGVRQPGAGSAKVIPEAEFNAKPAAEQARLMADGYTLT